jgi:hypothetical protein
MITLWEFLSLWWFSCEKHVLGPMLWVFIFLHFPLSFLLMLDPVSFHSFLVFCLLSLSFGPFNHFTYLHAPLCTLCFQSSLCVFCACQMFSILTAHFSHVPSVFWFFFACFPHTSSAFNPLYILVVLLIFFACSFHALCALNHLWMFSSCAWCYWSSSHILYACPVVLSILSAHAWSSIFYFSTLVHSILSTCAWSFVSCLSTFYLLFHLYAPSHEL